MTALGVTGLRELAKALGGEVNGGQVLAPGRGHSARDRSVAIKLVPDAPDGMVVYDHAGGDHLGAKDYVLARLGRRHERKGADRDSAPRRRVAEGETDPDRIKQDLALAIWRESLHPRGTPVETYLTRERGLPLPNDALGRALRFHPACPFGGGQRRPAMVALVQGIRTDAPQAVHRTVLEPDGRKSTVNGSDRWSLGPLRGGAVKLTPDAEVTACLGVGEGIETVLSLRCMPEASPDLPVWALLSTSGVRVFPPLSGIEGLWLAVDHDPGGAGERDARTCAKAWHAAGADVVFVKPTRSKTDLNDFFKLNGECNAAYR